MAQRHKEFPVPKLSSMLMRKMEPGEVVYVDAGHKVRTHQNLYQAQVNTTSRAGQLGMEVSTKVFFLVDPKASTLVPIVAIYCRTSAQPKKKGGRRAKITTESVDSAELGSVSDGSA